MSKDRKRKLLEFPLRNDLFERAKLELDKWDRQKKHSKTMAMGQDNEQRPTKEELPFIQFNPKFIIVPDLKEFLMERMN